MLAQLQQRLADIYRTEPGHDIRDFLITDRVVANALGADAMLTNTEETVFVAEDDGGLALSVYLDSDMLQRLEAGNPLGRLEPGQLDDLWKVLEGISHFNYLVWRATRDHSVTLLELEMQAEVDKFVSTLTLLMEQGDTDMLDSIHSWLFEAARLRDELDEEQRQRYTEASDYAGRFCHRIRDRLRDGDLGALKELRHFYRLSQTGKISHIHASLLS
ncbi:MAG: hypothetical protein AAGA61_02240 [Pseudomonadota bacterium]